MPRNLQLVACLGIKKPDSLTIKCSKRILRAMSTNANTTTMFKNVCLGGTFDGIHAGHRLLFKAALKICNQKLIVGVTDISMIKRKTLWELIAPVQERCLRVTEYLEAENPSLVYQVVPISDIYGPTITEKDIDCIVVSEETLRGAEKINQARKEKGWHELQVEVVSLVGVESASQEAAMTRLHEKKMSSSMMRLEKLGKIIRPPVENDRIPKRPYLIGVTGGVASGKTMICKYLESLGFGWINYDLLGHQTYAKVGSPTYNRVVEEFGEGVCNETSGEIERSRLGRIVFANREKLDKLNGIVWPAIYALVDEEIERLKQTHEVIILESALLIDSNQHMRVHQVWTTFVPPEVAVQRQMDSRGLSKEEAERRVSSQIDNLTRIQKSNAVFCSLWEPEFTQQQVRNCVQELREKYLGQ